MFLSKLLKATRSSQENDRTPTYTSNVTRAPTHNLTGRDSLTATLGAPETSNVATPTRSPNYIYYRIYAEDGGIPSKTPVAPGDPFLGRIKARDVPPPRTAKVVKRCIATVENIKDREMTSLFLTSFSESPMDDADKITILNGTGPGSTPQEPLALVAKMSDSERSALESDGREFVNAVELDTTHVDNQYVYYVLYVDDYAIPSKVAIDSEEPSLGCIRLDSIAPPHSPTFIKRCISRVEKNPFIARHADLFADTSCDSPLEEGHISFLRTDGPGLCPNEPMAIVVKNPLASIPDGRYLIKNRAADIFWNTYGNNPIKTVYFWTSTMENAKKHNNYQWDIKNDTNCNISMTSPGATSSWVGAEITGSTVPVMWRLIPADSGSYYLTTDMNRFSPNPRVPAAPNHNFGPGSMATLKEGDQCQMWEFIRI